MASSGSISTSPRSCRPMVSGENGTAIDAATRFAYPALERASRRYAGGFFASVTGIVQSLLSGIMGMVAGGQPSTGGATSRAAYIPAELSCLCHAFWDGAHLKPFAFSFALVSASGFSS